jgi:hypothetical protein
MVDSFRTLSPDESHVETQLLTDASANGYVTGGDNHDSQESLRKTGFPAAYRGRQRFHLHHQMAGVL